MKKNIFFSFFTFRIRKNFCIIATRIKIVTKWTDVYEFTTQERHLHGKIFS